MPDLQRRQYKGAAAMTPPTPSAQTVTADEWRVFDTTGTILNRTGNVLTITCESGEVANRVADQLRTSSLAAASARVVELREALKPFADFADALNDAVPDNIAIGIFADGAMRFGPSGGADVGSLRKASAALSQTEEGR